MNNIEHIFKKSGNMRHYAKNYLQYFTELLKQVDLRAVVLFVEELEKARKKHNTVFFIGNGGSAATATHMANDFGIGLQTKENSASYRAMALTDSISNLTAIANDYGFDKLFVNQLKVHYRPGDKLVAISASGNSANILEAVNWVKKQGGTVIGLVGFDGGKLKDSCHIAIHTLTPKGEYGPVEDMHLMIGHMIYMWLFNKECGGLTPKSQVCTETAGRYEL